MRRVTTTLALSLCMLGCGSGDLPADRVELTIATNAGRGGCYLNYHTVDLVADPQYGTAIEGNEARAPVYWPPNYSGHRVGSEVEVRDPTGNVVATTGRTYKYWPALAPEEGSAVIGSCLTP